MKLSSLHHFCVSDIPVTSLTHNTLGTCVDLKCVCADRPSTLPVVVFISVTHTLVTCQCSRAAVPRHRSPRCSVQHQHHLRRGDNSSHTFQQRQHTHTHIYTHTSGRQRHHSQGEELIQSEARFYLNVRGSDICVHTCLSPVFKV